MTREEAIERHRKMWHWLSENPGKEKCNYLLDFDPEILLFNYCYLCDYVEGEHKRLLCCECPLEWPSEYCCGGVFQPDARGLFLQWNDAKTDKNYTLAAEIAKQIAELPEKE